MEESYGILEKAHKETVMVVDKEYLNILTMTMQTFQEKALNRKV
jgi:hypothetical protein